MKLRVRGPNGTVGLAIPGPDSALSEDELTFGHLLSAIRTQCGIDPGSVKVGHPPRSVDLADDIPLIATGVEWANQLVTVEAKRVNDQSDENTTSHPPQEAPEERTVREPLSESALMALSVSAPTSLGLMVVRPMPDDNSCLFHAISAATLAGAGLSVTNAANNSLDVENLRARVARRINPSLRPGQEGGIDGDQTPQEADSERPEWLSEAGLGRAPADYADWIMKPESWGGEIEIKLLADELGVEISVVSVEPPHAILSHRPSSWDHDQTDTSSRTRCFLLYSGIHYDTLAVRLPGGNIDDIVTLFPVEDESYGTAASEIAAELFRKGYNTNTSSFGVRCNDCGWTGKGDADAQKHASEAGHYDFAEIDA